MLPLAKIVALGIADKIHQRHYEEPRDSIRALYDAQSIITGADDATPNDWA